VTEAADVGSRIDTLLVDKLRLFSRSQARQRVQQLTVNGRPSRLGRKVKAGDVVACVVVDPPPLDLAAQDLPLSVLYEDDEVIVVDKAQGMVVHPGSGNHDGTLVNALLFRCEGLAARFGTAAARPGIVHRLDKETSGVMIAAKTPGSHAALAEQFKSRSARKTYLAVVKGRLPAREGRIESRLGRDPRNRQRFTVVRAGGKLAVTRYRVLATYTAAPLSAGAPPESYALVLCAPRTGRTHQLRVHLRHAGAWVLGDPLYGHPDPRFPGATLMLHARSLSLRIPGAPEPRRFRAALPDRFRRVVRELQSFSPSQGL
jgi:23S rRNA pseudouridine1911/1915/1917 synthase